MADSVGSYVRCLFVGEKSSDSFELMSGLVPGSKQLEKEREDVDDI